jgi:hypothetical protein
MSRTAISALPPDLVRVDAHVLARHLGGRASNFDVCANRLAVEVFNRDACGLVRHLAYVLPRR